VLLIWYSKSEDVKMVRISSLRYGPLNFDFMIYNVGVKTVKLSL
jgi:hypothetical protein